MIIFAFQHASLGQLFMGKQWGLPIKKTEQLDAEGTIKKIMTTEYVQNALKGSTRRMSGSDPTVVNLRSS